MSGQLSPVGATPDDKELRSICEWVLEGGVVVLCPEGLRQLARGTLRLLEGCTLPE